MIPTLLNARKLQIDRTAGVPPLVDTQDVINCNIVLSNQTETILQIDCVHTNSGAGEVSAALPGPASAAFVPGPSSCEKSSEKLEPSDSRHII